MRFPNSDSRSTSADSAFGRSPLASGHSVVYQLIAATVVVFLLQLMTRRIETNDSLVLNWLAMERDHVLSMGQIWRLVTYAFVHSEHSLTHIAFNMLALYFLGRIVARTIGNREFLWFYLTSAFCAGMVQLCTMAINPTGEEDWVLGASGAVSAVFMLFAMYYPRMKLYFFGVLPIEARWLLAFAVTVDTLGFLGMAPSLFVPSGARVGHAAHLGGLMFGFLYFSGNMHLTRWWDDFAGRLPQKKASQNTLRVYNPDTQPEVNYSDRIDDILAKISLKGEASLSERERRMLNQASEHFRTRT